MTRDQAESLPTKEAISKTTALRKVGGVSCLYGCCRPTKPKSRRCR